MSFLDKVFGRSAEQAKRDFDLELPGGPWQEAHEPSHYSYNTEECREQVTISVSRSKQPLDTSQLMIGVLELVAVRQRVLQAVSEGSARFQEVHMMRNQKRKGFGWNRWSRRWLYSRLGLFDGYRVRRAWLRQKALPVGYVP